MKIEFNGNPYSIGNHIGLGACAGCVIYESINLQCPTDSEEQCILPLNKIYTDCCSNQVFKL